MNRKREHERQREQKDGTIRLVGKNSERYMDISPRRENTGKIEGMEPVTIAFGNTETDGFADVSAWLGHETAKRLQNASDTQKRRCALARTEADLTKAHNAVKDAIAAAFDTWKADQAKVRAARDAWDDTVKNAYSCAAAAWDAGWDVEADIPWKQKRKLAQDAWDDTMATWKTAIDTAKDAYTQKQKEKRDNEEEAAEAISLARNAWRIAWKAAWDAKKALFKKSILTEVSDETF